MTYFGIACLTQHTTTTKTAASANMAHVPSKGPYIIILWPAKPQQIYDLK